MIFLSSSSSKKQRIIESIKELVGHGIKNIELSGGTTYYNSIVDDIVCLREKYGLNYLIHNYFPPPKIDFVLNIISPLREIREKSFSFIEYSLKLCSKLNIPFYSFHAGYTKNLIPVRVGGYFIPDESKAYRKIDSSSKFLDTVEQIAKIAKSCNCKIAVENLFPINETENFSMMCAPNEILSFLKHFKENESVGLLLDLGHLNVAANYMNFDKCEIAENLIKNYSNKIFGIHVSENNGKKDEHRILNINSWQVETLSNNRTQVKGKPITIEWFNEDENSDFAQIKTIIDVLNKNS